MDYRCWIVESRACSGRDSCSCRVYSAMENVAAPACRRARKQCIVRQGACSEKEEIASVVPTGCQFTMTLSYSHRERSVAISSCCRLNKRLLQ